MTMEPRYEIGADYDGVDKRHLQVDETKKFTNEVPDRIFYPECGVFYTESLAIWDLNTNKELIRGTDYIVHILDQVATSKSGKEVCGLIEVTNLDVLGVRYQYQFVGGLHMSGYYILEQLLKMYSGGINSIINYDDIMNIPEEHDPAYHTQHVHRFYGTESLLVAIERLRQGLVVRYNPNLESMYTNIEERLTAVYTNIRESDTTLNNSIIETQGMLSVQTDEYILTSSAVNPKTARGYGEWELITDAILNSNTGTLVVGSGRLLTLGNSPAIIKNCYIWKNIKDTTLIDFPMELTIDRNSIDEGGVINATLKTQAGPATYAFTIVETTVTGKHTGNSDLKPNRSNFSVNASGEGVVSITAVKDRLTEGTRSYRLFINNFPRIYVDFVVLDTSTSFGLDLVQFEMDETPLATVGEGQPFHLRIIAAPGINTTAFIEWSKSASLEYVDDPATEVQVVNGKATVPVMMLADNTDNGPAVRWVIARVSLDPDNKVVSNDLPHPHIARIEVLDTSKVLAATINFNNTTNQPLTTLNENSNFIIKINTNGIEGSRVNLTYASTKPLSDFVGLIPTATVDASGSITIPATLKPDFKTTGSLQTFTVNVLVGSTTVASRSISITDTSKDPILTSRFVKTLEDLTPIPSVNEGETFFFIINAEGYDGSVPIYLDVEAIGVAPVSGRVTTPDLGRPLVLGNGNGVGFTLIDPATLAIQMTAVADFALRGSYDLLMSYKTQQSNTPNRRGVVINDTSVPTMTATWSSSAVTLTPITKVSELGSDPANNYNGVAYLWLQAFGEFDTFINPRIELAANSVAKWTDVSMPTTINLVNKKQVIKAVFSADFVTEGNELLALKGVADNYSKGFFETSVLIEDTAFVHNLGLTVTTVPNRPGGTYSDALPVALKVDVPAFPFVTRLEVTVDVPATGKKLISYTQVPVGSAQVSVTGILMNDERTYITASTYNVNISVRRVGSNNEEFIFSTDKKQVTLSVRNENLKPTISFDMFDGIGVVTELEEGKTYTQRAILRNPPYPDSKMVMGFQNRATNGGAIGADYGQMTIADDYICRPMLNPTDAVHTRTVVVTNNRSTDIDRDVEIFAAVDWGKVRADGSVFDGFIADKYVTAVRKYPIRDTSKTATFALRLLDVNNTVVTNITEGMVLRYEFTVTNGTIGDYYTLELATGNINKYTSSSSSGFGKSFTVTNSTSQVFVWEVSTVANNLTDGDQTHKVIVSANYNANVKEQTYVIKDTSKTPILSIQAYKKSDLSPVGIFLDDGTEYVIGVNSGLGRAGVNITLEQLYTSRPLVDYQVHSFNAIQPTDAQGIAWFPFQFKAEYVTHGVGELRVRGKTTDITSSPTNAYSITVYDQLTTKGITFGWFDSSNVAITKVREGESAVLKVTAGGGRNPMTMVVENNGGRPEAQFQTHGFGQYTKPDDAISRALTFIPLSNNTTDEGANKSIKVKIRYLDGPSTFDVVTELPIVDTSTSTTANVQVFKDGQLVTSLEEGASYTAKFTLTRPVLDAGRYRVQLISGNHAGTGLNVDLVTQVDGADGFKLESGNIYTLSLPFTVASDGVINPEGDLYIDMRIRDVETGTYLSTSRIYIIDTESLAPVFTLWVEKTTDTTKITSLDEGTNGFVRVSALRYQGNLSIEFTGDVTGAGGVKRLDFGAQSGYPAIWTVPNKDMWYGSTPIRALADETTNPNPNGNLLLKNASGEVVATYAFNVVDISQTPEITSVYYAKDAAGTVAINDSIVPSALTANTFYLQVTTKHLDLTKGRLEVNHPGSGVGDDYFLGNVDLVVGTASESFVDIVDFQMDNATKIGKGYVKYTFKERGAANMPNGGYGDSPNYLLESFYDGDNGDDRDDYIHLAFGQYIIESRRYDWLYGGPQGTTPLIFFLAPPQTYVGLLAPDLNGAASAGNYGFTIVNFDIMINVKDYWNDTSKNGEWLRTRHLLTSNDNGTTPEFWIKFSGGAALKMTRVGNVNGGGYGTYVASEIATVEQAYQLMAAVNYFHNLNGYTDVVISKTQIA